MQFTVHSITYAICRAALVRVSEHSRAEYREENEPQVVELILKLMLYSYKGLMRNLPINSVDNARGCFRGRRCRVRDSIAANTGGIQSEQFGFPSSAGTREGLSNIPRRSPSVPLPFYVRAGRERTRETRFTRELSVLDCA